MIIINWNAWKLLLTPLKLLIGLEKRLLKVWEANFLMCIVQRHLSNQGTLLVLCSHVIIVFPVGINDLHKFVSVALHTSVGEGDFANDNLSRLKIVGSGYSPLIYDLQLSKPSFENFKTCCRKVWDALQQTPNLPSKLVSSVVGFSLKL